MQVVQSGLKAALRREVAAGVRLAIALRLFAVIAISVWVIERVGLDASFHYIAILAVLLFSGVFQWRLAPRAGTLRHVAMAALIFLDMCAVTYALVVPPPGAPDIWPVAMQLRLGNFDYFYIFIALTTLTYAPVLSLWTGISAAIAWSIGVLYVLSDANSFTRLDFDAIRQLSTAELIALLTDPNYVSSVIWAQEILIAVILGAIMTATAYRSRHLAFKEAKAAAERTNLSRYFSPNIVDELAGNREDLVTVRSHDVSILFCDVVGFTRLCERQNPGEVIELLRDIHGRLARAVFDHQGTVEKYLGDGLMATYGTPRPREGDAARALKSAFAMVEGIEQMNAERVRSGQEPVDIAIGLHSGPAVLGNIGDEMMLEFAVVGDTVNVASRLEGLTRDFSATMIVSEDLLEAAQAAKPADRHDVDELVAALRVLPAQSLKNRVQPVAARALLRCNDTTSQRPLDLKTHNRNG